MTDYLGLKFGTTKEVSLDSPIAVAAYYRYRPNGAPIAINMREESADEKRLLCDLIDAVETVGGRIVDEWSGNRMTAEQAKRYVMGETIDRDTAQAEAIAGLFHDALIGRKRDKLIFKFGAIKHTSLHSAAAKAANDAYKAARDQSGRPNRRDTPEDRKRICDLIDAIDGYIVEETSAYPMTKDEAKRYVMGSGAAKDPA
jgi:hypothetical protein